LSALFKLIEEESSPFKIAKLGPALLEKTLSAFKELADYLPLI